MNPKTIEIVKATAPVVGAHATEITSVFYKTMFANSPEAKRFFNVANQNAGRQPQALANAIVAYATNIDNLGVLGDAVELMATKHCGLQVLPEHYHIVHDNLMIAVGKVLGAAVTPEIANAWSEAVMFLAGILIGEEEKLYKMAESRAGGWRGWKNFKLASKENVATDVKTFTFVPEDGTRPSFDFTPGQYLSIIVDVEGNGDYTSPRHYTVTSNPGDNFFQITTKRISGGVVSSYMHDVLNVGGVVKLSPPFGPFKVESDPENVKTSVLISAGVGMTPMKSFLDSLGPKVVKAVHVDKNEHAVPFLNHFNTINAGRNAFYFSQNGRPKADNIVGSVISEVGADHRYYICGPPTFMRDVVHSLVAHQVPRDRIHWEAFSPQLSCPV